jgi:hypothetical protein
MVINGYQWLSIVINADMEVFSSHCGSSSHSPMGFNTKSWSNDLDDLGVPILGNLHLFINLIDSRWLNHSVKIIDINLTVDDLSII